MRANRSIPNATVIPELAYADPGAAAQWLCRVFNFSVRLRIGNHRVQLNVGDGAVVAMDLGRGSPGKQSVLVRIDDLDQHHWHARMQGARIVRAPEVHPFGERQYTAEDCGGHLWTFSQTIADAAPEDWGGESVDLQG